MWVDKEYVNPFDKDDKNFWIKIEHIGRYLYAVDVIKQRLHRSCVVADMGCAIGYGTKLLSAVAGRVTGFDCNEKYLGTAKMENVSNNTSYRYIDLQAECEKDLHESFDCIVAFEVLEHIDDARIGLEVFKSALMDGGILICSVPNDKFECCDDNGYPLSAFHKRAYTKDMVLSMLSDAEFTVERVLGQYLPNVLAKKEAKMMRKRKSPMFTVTHDSFREKEFIDFFGYLLGYPTVENIEDSYSFIYIAQKVRKGK